MSFETMDGTGHYRAPAVLVLPAAGGHRRAGVFCREGRRAEAATIACDCHHRLRSPPGPDPPQSPEAWQLIATTVTITRSNTAGCTSGITCEGAKRPPQPHAALFGRQATERPFLLHKVLGANTNVTTRSIQG